MQGALETIRADLLSVLSLCYRAPSHIESPEQAKFTLDMLVDAFVRLNPTLEEWTAVKTAFVTEWSRPTWPLPSEFPQRLAKLRASTRDEASLRVALHSPRSQGWQPPTPAERAEFDEARRDALQMAESPDPQTAAWGQRCLVLARAIERNEANRAAGTFGVVA